MFVWRLFCVCVCCMCVSGRCVCWLVCAGGGLGRAGQSSVAAGRKVYAAEPVCVHDAGATPAFPLFL